MKICIDKVSEETYTELKRNKGKRSWKEFLNLDNFNKQEQELNILTSQLSTADKLVEILNELLTKTKIYLHLSLGTNIVLLILLVLLLMYGQ